MNSDIEKRAQEQREEKKGWPLVQDWMFSIDSLPHFVGLTLQKPTSSVKLKGDLKK